MLFNKFVTESEIRNLIPSNEIEDWINSLLCRFHVSEDAKQYLILRKGIVQEIFDELIPLAKYAKHQYNDPDVFLKFYPGSKTSFDADFVDNSGNLLERVEVTMAVKGQQNRIQREALIKYGHSSFFHTPNYSGNKKNRVINEPECCIIDSSDIIAEQSTLLQTAYNKKHSKLHKYPDTTLLIGLNIPLLMNWEYEQVIRDFHIHKNTFTSIKCVEITTGKYWFLK